MNGPSTRSAPSPPCMRPNSTVPNTTSSRPDARASTSAHATWHTLAALTPSARARSRSRRPAPRVTGSRASSIPLPSPRTSSSPNGAVGSSTSPSSSRKNASCSSGSRPAAPAPRSCGTAAAAAARPRAPPGAPGSPPAAPPASCGRRPGGGSSSSSSQRPPRRVVGRRAARSSGAARTSIRWCRGSKRAHSCSRHVARRPGPARTSSTRSGACRHTTCTGSRSPSQSTAVRRMSCRATTACSAPRYASSRARFSKPSSARQQVRVALAAPAGGGRGSPPAAAPAGRCPARSPRRPGTAATIRSISVLRQRPPAAASPA